MANNDDVLIIGSLKDKDLRDSINELVNFVGDKTNDMANKFTEGLDKMKLAMKDFAITQKVSVDLMKDAWRDMSSAFDTMVAAQSNATGSNRNGGNTQSYNPNTVGALEQELALMEKERKEIELGTQALRDKNLEIEKTRDKLKQETTSDPSKQAKAYANEIQKVSAMYDKTLPEAERKLRELLRIKNELRATPVLDETKMERLNSQIKRLIASIRDMRTNAKGNTLKDVLGMDESSVDAIARKMRALKSVKVSNSSDIHKLGDEYQRLSRLQADLLGKGIQLTHSNNYLAQSFGYIRNRLVYAMTLGAVTSFVKQIYEVRGQYEMLERSLGILIDDMRRGSELFNELNAMAIKSPFTLVELATGAKQLLAYNFAEEEVVDTTRRLADISAALGVPMERLVYNLGQIRAQTVLTARDARDFANAGLAIVPMLAKLYTEEKRFGDQIVTTAQVFDMMSDKMVSYSDVMKVINQVTDEGGKFFDFQAKQAETLRVKMANLTLAWNNMLNEIGSENQSMLTLPINGLKLLFENWKAVYDIVSDLVILYGVYRARAILISIVNGTLISQGVISGMFQLGRAVSFVASAWKILSVAVASNPIGAIATVVAAGAVAMGLFNDNVSKAVEYQERFGRAGAKTVSDLETYFTSLENISKESSNYKKVMSELNSILGEYDMQLVTENDTQEQINDKRRVSIQLIKEEILERKHLNEVQQGRSEYETKVEDVRKRLRESLGDAITDNFLGIGTINKEIAENAPAIANIVADVIERNIDAIAGKTGDEYQKGVDKIFDEIGKRMEAIGLSESTRNKAWLENTLFRSFTDSNIIKNAINDIANAKNELDNYTEALDKAYEAEKKAAVDGANFNDRVEQTQRRLMDAAYDTDNFAKKVKQLLKDYGGQNVIDFLVKVKTEVPAWMSQKGLDELKRLSARFSALATNAKKAGKTSLNVNGKEFSVDELFQRAAQYTQAAESKAKDIESRKSSTITKEASDALKNYKAALDAATVAQNRFNRGKADQALVTEKTKAVQEAYNKALDAGVSKEELAKAKNKGKGGGSKKDPLGDALTKEIQLITDMRKMYKEYQKAGVDADTARIASAKEYEKTLKTTNATLQKYGIKGLSGEELATMDLRKVRDYYKSMLETASRLGNTKGVAALEKAIHSLNTEITKIDYKKITDGLNNELSQLKDEYELGIELDANPQLGNMFADMFNIDTSSLPKTFDDALKRVQGIVDKALGGLNIEQPFDILKDDVHKFAESVGQSLDGDAIKGLENAQKYIRDLWKKYTSDTIKEWNGLISKYGKLQDKLLKIQKDTVKEQLKIIRNFGKDEDYKKALDISNKLQISDDPQEVTRLQAEFTELLSKVAKANPQAVPIVAATTQEASQLTSKAYWEDFKNSDFYSMMFEDMSRNSTQALQLIIDKMNVLKDKVKEDPASQKALMQGLQEATKEFESRSSTTTVVSALKEIKKAQDEVSAAKKEQTAANQELEDSERALKSAQSTGDAKAIAAASERIARAKERQKEADEKAALASNKLKAATTKLRGGMDVLSSELENVQGLLGAVSKLFRAAGDDDTADAIDAINEGFTIMTTVIMGVVAAMIILESTQPWLLAIAAALSVIIGLFSFLSGNKDKDIEKDIKKSELAVKRLENSYKNLERAIENAYGASQIGARKAAIANKELQLTELQRQLQLEKSKSSKKRDADRIADLEGQIIEMRNQIEDMRNDITNSFLGISSVADAVNSMASDIVDSLRNGKNAMEGFTDSIDDMIANMIKQVFASRVVGPMIKKIWDKIDQDIQKRGESYADYYAKYKSSLDHIDANNGEGYYFWKDKSGSLWYSNSWMKWQKALRKGAENLTYQQWHEILSSWADWAKEHLEDATTPTMNDVRTFGADLREIAPELEGYIGQLDDILREMGLIKDATSEEALSKLQQGIQGVTEDTAGSIEAYMNIVAQRIFEQNQYLQEIRNCVISFNLDVQLGTLSQMLLQLQQSYQVQLAIQGILNGWSTPNGMAVRVEMN